MLQSTHADPSWWPQNQYIGPEGAVALVLFLLILAAAVRFYLSTPDLDALARREGGFWEGLEPNERGYIGVLYSERRVIVRFVEVRRLSVTLKHQNPARDRVLFRGSENPNTFSPDDEIRAFANWVRAAYRYGVPAVYTALRITDADLPLHLRIVRQIGAMYGEPKHSKTLRILPPDQFNLLLADPTAYLARFRQHLLTGAQLPSAGKWPDIAADSA